VQHLGREISSIRYKANAAHLQDATGLEVPDHGVAVRAAGDEPLVDALEPRLGRIVLQAEHAAGVEAIVPEDLAAAEVEAQGDAAPEAGDETVAVELDGVDAVAESLAGNVGRDRGRTGRGVKQGGLLEFVHGEETVTPVVVEEGAGAEEVTPIDPGSLVAVVVDPANA
jgi:hypothetical protein